MLSDVADARRPVRTEQKGENLSDEIGVCLALSHIFAAFSTRTKTMLVDTGPNFAPRSLFVESAAGATLRKVFSASAAVKTACSYESFV